jgi:hypothetical protein
VVLLDFNGIEFKFLVEIAIRLHSLFLLESHSLSGRFCSTFLNQSFQQIARISVRIPQLMGSGTPCLSDNPPDGVGRHFGRGHCTSNE